MSLLSLQRTPGPELESPMLSSWGLEQNTSLLFCTTLYEKDQPCLHTPEIEEHQWLEEPEQWAAWGVFPAIMTTSQAALPLGSLRGNAT